jgi:hypothetical protein
MFYGFLCSYFTGRVCNSRLRFSLSSFFSLRLACICLSSRRCYGFLCCGSFDLCGFVRRIFCWLG